MGALEDFLAAEQGNTGTAPIIQPDGLNEPAVLPSAEVDAAGSVQARSPLQQLMAQQSRLSKEYDTAAAGRSSARTSMEQAYKDMSELAKKPVEDNSWLKMALAALKPVYPWENAPLNGANAFLQSQEQVNAANRANMLKGTGMDVDWQKAKLSDYRDEADKLLGKLGGSGAGGISGQITAQTMVARKAMELMSQNSQAAAKQFEHRDDLTPEAKAAAISDQARAATFTQLKALAPLITSQTGSQLDDASIGQLIGQLPVSPGAVIQPPGAVNPIGAPKPTNVAPSVPAPVAPQPVPNVPIGAPTNPTGGPDLLGKTLRDEQINQALKRPEVDTTGAGVQQGVGIDNLKRSIAELPPEQQQQAMRWLNQASYAAQAGNTQLAQQNIQKVAQLAGAANPLDSSSGGKTQAQITADAATLRAGKVKTAEEAAQEHAKLSNEISTRAQNLQNASVIVGDVRNELAGLPSGGKVEPGKLANFNASTLAWFKAMGVPLSTKDEEAIANNVALAKSNIKLAMADVKSTFARPAVFDFLKTLESNPGPEMTVTTINKLLAIMDNTIARGVQENQDFSSWHVENPTSPVTDFSNYRNLTVTQPAWWGNYSKKFESANGHPPSYEDLSALAKQKGMTFNEYVNSLHNAAKKGVR